VSDCLHLTFVLLYYHSRRKHAVVHDLEDVLNQPFPICLWVLWRASSRPFLPEAGRVPSPTRFMQFSRLPVLPRFWLGSVCRFAAARYRGRASLN